MRKAIKKPKECVCKECGVRFTHPVSKRKYCDAHQNIARSVGWKTAQARPRANPFVEKACGWCKKKYVTFRHATHRQFCSYQCFVDSGGTVRAGLAARAAVARYGAKKDANHSSIIKLLKKFAIPHIDLSALGCGVPDLLVEIRGELRLWEIKNRKTTYGRKGLNKNQLAWAAKWAGNPIAIINTEEDAMKEIGVKKADAA